KSTKSSKKPCLLNRAPGTKGSRSASGSGLNCRKQDAHLSSARAQPDKISRLLIAPFAFLSITSEIEELFDDANGDLAIGELSTAIEKYRKCVERLPTFFDGWHALGMTLMKNGNYPEAIQAGKQAVELRPNDQLAWSSRSRFYVGNNPCNEAEAAGVTPRILAWGQTFAPE